MCEDKQTLYDWVTDNKRNWEIICPLCKSKMEITKLIDKEVAEVKCFNEKCKFIFNIEWMWYKIKASDLSKKLIINYGLNSKDAWRWANEVKYMNPTFFISAVKERSVENDSLRKIILPILRSNEKSNILVLGANYNLELYAFEGLGEYISQIVCSDVSNNILYKSYNLHHNDLSEKIWNDSTQSQIYYSKNFAENLAKKMILSDFSKGKDGTHSFTANGMFDICLLLKLIQSDYFDERFMMKTLLNIADKLKDGGTVIFSISKGTAYIVPEQEVESTLSLKYDNILENLSKNKIKTAFVSGVYKRRDLLHQQENKVDLLVDEILKLGVYEDVIVYYGKETSYEYFISCKRINREEEV